MDKNLIFLFISCCIVIFSIIVFYTDPIMSSLRCGLKYKNCEIYSDFKSYLNHLKVIGAQKINEDYVKFYEKGRNLCNRQKTIYRLEYTSLIVNIFLGSLCVLLSLFHYFGIGKNFEKYTGLIGFISGVIGFILSLVYICYCGYIFIFDNPNMSDSNDCLPIPSSPNPYAKNNIIITKKSI